MGARRGLDCLDKIFAARHRPMLRSHGTRRSSPSADGRRHRCRRQDGRRLAEEEEEEEEEGLRDRAQAPEEEEEEGTSQRS